MGKVWEMLRRTWQEFRNDNCPRLAAALSYYTVFSLAPFLVVVMAVAGLAAGQQAARGEVLAQMQGVVGPESARMIQDMLQAAYRPGLTGLAAVLGGAALLLGATSLFLELQSALNLVWKVQAPPGGGLRRLLLQRLLSLGLVLAVGFLLLVSLLLHAALRGFFAYLAAWLGPGLAAAVLAAEQALALLLMTLLFALIFKVLPDAVIRWRDVWIGALVTAILFGLGRVLIGLYLARTDPGANYGSAGAAIIVLLWINYSAGIMFLGAEFTQVHARSKGWRPRPKGGTAPPGPGQKKGGPAGPHRTEAAATGP